MLQGSRYPARSRHAKKVVSDSQGLMDFAIGLVNCVLNLPDGKWSILRNLTDRRTVKWILLIKKFWGLFEMTFGLVNASFSFPEWQAVKMTFFAPWRRCPLNVLGDKVEPPQTATSLQRPLFCPSRQKIHTWTLVYNLSTTATSLQLPLSSVPKVAVVESFNCIIFNLYFIFHIKDTDKNIWLHSPLMDQRRKM